MKIFFASLFAVITLSVHAQSKIDVLHYKYEIELNDRTDSVYGQATINIRFLEDMDSFSLDLKNPVASSKKGMTALVTGGLGKTNAAHTFHKDNKIWIVPGNRIRAGDQRTYQVSYSGIPTDGLIISKNKYGNRTFFADNWPNRAHNWIPCNDDPADKASVEFIVTAPSHYQVISNGILVEETNLPGNKKLTHYKEDIELPTKVMVIGAADFAVNRVGDIDCIPVYSWVFPENKQEGFTDYAMAKDILAYHINYIGPFPYRKLANVQSKTIFGGMENAGAIFYSESSVTGNKYEEALLSHEIIHQWFGDMATEKSFAHLWLSEGFATYLTHVYIESKYGTDSLNNEMKNDRKTVIDFVKRTHRPVVDSTTDLMSLLNSNSYQKGSWVLHMLRRELGDSVFHESIRRYCKMYSGKNAETKDLQKVFETVSGKNLDQFFKQWLFTPENPSLQLTWDYDAKKSEVRVNIRQLQNTVFQFPFTIAMITNSGASVMRLVHVDKKEMNVSFSMPEKPKQISADPLTSLLFEATIVEKK